MAVFEDAGISLSLLVGVSTFWAAFGVCRPVRYEMPIVAGDYDHALHVDSPDAPSFLDEYINEEPLPRVGGEPNVTEKPAPPP